ncbi:hypothetical protein [Streptomyces kronopolitis]|uniref:hypothetical protein n=1 Tax=Streptomyces kronopolitis TaxID=1612435 RepID=UPI003427C21D
MTFLAVALVLGWAIGIGIGIGGVLTLARHDLFLATAFMLRPAVTSLYCAVVIVWWPAALIATLLLRWAERSARR